MKEAEGGDTTRLWADAFKRPSLKAVVPGAVRDMTTDSGAAIRLLWADMDRCAFE